MTNEELIEALTTLKEQAQYYGDNTFVWSINIDSFNFVIDHTIKALKQEPTPKNDLGVDAVSRQAVLELIADYDLSMGQVVRGIHELPSVTPQEPKWIPVSEKLPKDLEPVNITWINHDPEPYYNDIKDKPFTATGVYFNGQWYWWSTLCTDILAEYSHNYDDIIDDAIEVTAWMPLPQPYREVEE